MHNTIQYNVQYNTIQCMIQYNVQYCIIMYIAHLNQNANTILSSGASHFAAVLELTTEKNKKQEHQEEQCIKKTKIYMKTNVYIMF